MSSLLNILKKFNSWFIFLFQQFCPPQSFCDSDWAPVVIQDNQWLVLVF